MTTGVDFVTRAHALWRVRMAQWQQRLRFFSTLSLCATGAGAIIAPQFLLMPEEIKVAMQCMLANSNCPILATLTCATPMSRPPTPPKARPPSVS